MFFFFNYYKKMNFVSVLIPAFTFSDSYTKNSVYKKKKKILLDYYFLPFKIYFRIKLSKNFLISQMIQI